MQRDAIALAVEDDGAAAVRRYGMGGLQDLAAILLDFGDGRLEAAVAVQIDQRSRRTRLLFLRLEHASAHLSGVRRQEGKLHGSRVVHWERRVENCRVERDGALEIA